MKGVLLTHVDKDVELDLQVREFEPEMSVAFVETPDERNF